MAVRQRGSGHFFKRHGSKAQTASRLVQGGAPLHLIGADAGGVVGADEGQGGHPQGQAHMQRAAVVGHQEPAAAEQGGHGPQGIAPAGHQAGALNPGGDGLSGRAVLGAADDQQGRPVGLRQKIPQLDEVVRRPPFVRVGAGGVQGQQ